MSPAQRSQPRTGERLRVLYVDYSVGFGGAIKSLSLTLRGLDNVAKVVATSQSPDLVRTWLSGYEVRPIRRWLNYRTKEAVRRWVARRAPFRLAEWAAGKLLALADVIATAMNSVRLAVLIRRRHIQLIHLNNGFVPPEALFAARITHTPCLVHLRDFQRDEALARAAVAGGGVVHVIAVSGAVARSLEPCGVPSRKITVVHDPVDTTELEAAAAARDRVRAQLGLRPEQVVAAIFGRVVPWKGQLEFVRASLEAMAADPSLHVLIVGDESDGGREYLSGILEVIRTSPFADRFTLAGYQSRVEDYYAAVDIVVHASITPEPFGMVVPEALSAERAVIATNAGGPREVITDGVDGLLVPAADCAAMAEAILALSRNAELRLRMGANGRRKVVARLGLAQNARRVATVYETALRSFGRPLAGPAAVPPSATRPTGE